MSSFEERKEEYYERLAEHQELVKSLIEKKDINSNKVASILLNPKNEEELKFSNILIGFEIDIKELVSAIVNGQVKEQEIEESEGVKSLIEIIREAIKLYKMGILLDSEKLKAYFENDLNKDINRDELCAKIAQATFDLGVCFINDSENTLKYILNQFGFSLDSDLELDVISNRLNSLKNEIEEKQKEEKANGEIKEVKITTELVDALGIYTDEFHKICEKNIDNTKENDMSSIFKILIK